MALTAQLQAHKIPFECSKISMCAIFPFESLNARIPPELALAFHRNVAFILGSCMIPGAACSARMITGDELWQ